LRLSLSSPSNNIDIHFEPFDDLSLLFNLSILATEHHNHSTPYISTTSTASSNMSLASAGPNVPGNNSLRHTLPISVREGRTYSSRERKQDSGWANSYWKTGLPYTDSKIDWVNYLTEHQVYHKKSDGLATLKARAVRCARGRRSYDGRNVKMLRELAQDYGLRISLDREASRDQLAKALDNADEDKQRALKASSKFHRFSELPSELRNRIYAYHFKSLGKVPPRFITPPLCRASRQLRVESTGLFFENCTFVVQLKPMHGKAQLHYHTEVAKFNIPKPAFDCIKHLCIELRSPSNDSLWDAWIVDLVSGQCVETNTDPKSGGKKGEHHVRELVASIMAREGHAKLEKSDLIALESAVTKQYWAKGV
jgi:hypothetical protein